MGVDATKSHAFTLRKLLVECLPHLAVVFLYLIVAKGSGVLFPNFPLLFVGVGILSLCVVGWKASLKKKK